MSRCGSDSDTDTEPIARTSHEEKPRPRIRSSSDPDGRKRKDRDRKRLGLDKDKGQRLSVDKKEEKDSDTEKEKCMLKSDQSETGACQHQESQPIQPEVSTCDSNDKEEVKAADEQPSVSSDSCRSDSRVLFSPSSDSLDALEEDDFISCSSSAVHHRSPSQAHCYSPLELHPYAQANVQSHLLAPPPAHSHPLIQLTARISEGCRRSGDGADPQLLSPSSPSPSCPPQCPGNPSTEDRSLCFAELSRLVDFLPSPPEASEEDDDLEEELRKRRREQLRELDVSISRAGEGGSESGEHAAVIPSPCSLSAHADYVFNFDHGDARCYYSLCSNITPDSARSLPRPQQQDKEIKAVESELEAIPILQPPPGFGDSSSDDEFFDARDGFTSPEDPTSGTRLRGKVVFFFSFFFLNSAHCLSWKSIGIMKAQEV